MSSLDWTVRNSHEGERTWTLSGADMGWMTPLLSCSEDILLLKGFKVWCGVDSRKKNNDFTTIIFFIGQEDKASGYRGHNKLKSENAQQISKIPGERRVYSLPASSRGLRKGCGWLLLPCCPQVHQEVTVIHSRHPNQLLMLGHCVTIWRRKRLQIWKFGLQDRDAESQSKPEPKSTLPVMVLGNKCSPWAAEKQQENWEPFKLAYPSGQDPCTIQDITTDCFISR